MSNQELAKLLTNVAASYIIKDERKFHFQIVAYQNAAETINGLTKEVKDYYKEGRLNEIPNIGKTLISHFEELFKTGKATQFEFALRDIPVTVFPLLDVPSFGPKKAYKLTQEFKLINPETVLDDLEILAKDNRIAPLKGFGEKSQADILQAIAEFRQGAGKTTRMTLPYAQEVADIIVEYMKTCPAIIEVEPLGSLRRKVATIGDIDLAATTDEPKKVIEHFVNYPYVERVIEKGDVSSSILTSGGKQIDLIVLEPQRFGSLLQHFTGSKNHNVHLREIALRKGLSLSERGIKTLNDKAGTIQAFDTEEKFYNAIGLSWIPPELREDLGEIELAQKNQLPELVELSDIKGDLHLHSSYPIEPSHDLGKNNFEEILATAKELNYEYVGFSEHNPSVAKHTPKKIYEILQRRNEEIEQLKSDTKNVRIFKLLETDILPNGNLAIDNKCLEILDGTIVSVHSVFNLNREDMTKRVIAGLSHPKAKILAHPTGRILNNRPGYDLDWDKIFAFCKQNNKALEINSSPDRLDLSDSIIRLAVAAGVNLIIDTDSHATTHMTLMKYGIFMARRGWATKNDILNSLSYNEFLEWLKK